MCHQKLIIFIDGEPHANRRAAEQAASARRPLNVGAGYDYGNGPQELASKRVNGSDVNYVIDRVVDEAQRKNSQRTSAVYGRLVAQADHVGHGFQGSWTSTQKLT